MKNQTDVKSSPLPKGHPWNKGKAVGQMKPFTRQQVRNIKEFLEEKRKWRDLALFSVAIDTMLRSSDLLKLTVADVINSDRTVRAEFSVKQKKTGEGNLVAVSEKTRAVVSRWIKESGKDEDDYLFTGLKGKRKYTPITHRQFTRLVKSWAKLVHLDPREYSTHSLRRSKAAYIYNKTNNPELVRQLLGQKSVTATSYYLNISKRQALEVAKETEF